MFHDFLQQNHPARGTTQEAPKSCDNTGLALARVTTWPFLPGGPGGPGGILMDDGQGIHTFIYIYYIETYCIMLYMYNTTLYFILYFTISYYIILYHILLFHIISCYVYKLCPKEPCKKWSCVEKKQRSLSNCVSTPMRWLHTFIKEFTWARKGKRKSESYILMAIFQCKCTILLCIYIYYTNVSETQEWPSTIITTLSWGCRDRYLFSATLKVAIPDLRFVLPATRFSATWIYL
jgi:hypothetical protein